MSKKDVVFHGKAVGGMLVMPGAPTFILMWLFFGLPFLLAVVAAVAMPALYTGLAGTYLALEPRRERKRALKEAQEDEQLALWRLMTHLTPLDEAWLAERHHYVVPKQVARLRSGKEHDWTPHYSDSKVPIPIQNRNDLAKRAKKAKQEFKGVYLTEGSGVNAANALDSFQTQLPDHLMPAVADVQKAIETKKREDQAKELEAKKELARQAKPTQVTNVSNLSSFLTGPFEGDIVDPPRRTRGSR